MGKIILLILSVNIAASEFTLEAGYYLDAGIQINQESKWLISTVNPFYISMYTKIDIIKIGDFKLFGDGGVATYMIKTSYNNYFNPIYVSYDIGAGITWQNLTIGILHNCAHPINACANIFKDQVIKRDTTYERVYLRYKMEW